MNIQVMNRTKGFYYELFHDIMGDYYTIVVYVGNAAASGSVRDFNDLKSSGGIMMYSHDENLRVHLFVNKDDRVEIDVERSSEKMEFSAMLTIDRDNFFKKLTSE